MPLYGQVTAVVLGVVNVVVASKWQSTNVLHVSSPVWGAGNITRWIGVEQEFGHIPWQGFDFLWVGPANGQGASVASLEWLKLYRSFPGSQEIELHLEYTTNLAKVLHAVNVELADAKDRCPNYERSLAPCVDEVKHLRTQARILQVEAKLAATSGGRRRIRTAPRLRVVQRILPKASPSEDSSFADFLLGRVFQTVPKVYGGGDCDHLKAPSGLALGPNGKVYIVDTRHHRVLLVQGSRCELWFGGSGEGTGQSQLWHPIGVAVGSHGNMIIADSFNNRVLLKQPGAMVGEVVMGKAGRGPGLDQIDYPSDVLFVDDGLKGFFFVTDAGNHRVLRLSVGDWEVSLAFGGEGPGDGLHQLHYPRGLAFHSGNGEMLSHRRWQAKHGVVFDWRGLLFIADMRNHRIIRAGVGFHIFGNQTKGHVVFGGRGPGGRTDQLQSPEGIALAHGMLYIADTGNDRILRVNLGGMNQTSQLESQGESFFAEVVFGAASRPGVGGHALNELKHPRMVIPAPSLSPQNAVQLYVVDKDNNRILLVTVGQENAKPFLGKAVPSPSPQDTFTVNNEGGGKRSKDEGASVPLSVPTGIVLTNTSLLVADERRHRIVSYGLVAGVNEVIFGHYGAGSTLDSLNSPSDLSFAEDGSIFVADTQNHRVLRIKEGASQGDVAFGGQGAGDSMDQLSYPKGLAVCFLEDQLVLLIADTGNHRLLRVKLFKNTGMAESSDAEILTGGHGPGNELHQLRRPHGVAVDTMGAVYIADTGNNRVLYLSKGLEGGTHRSAEMFCGNGVGIHLTGPQGLALSEETLFVSDTGNNRVLQVQRTRSGEVRIEVVRGGTVPGAALNLLHSPNGLAFAGGTICIADSMNKRIVCGSAIPSFVAENVNPLNTLVRSGAASWHHNRDAEEEVFVLSHVAHASGSALAAIVDHIPVSHGELGEDAGSCEVDKGVLDPKPPRVRHLGLLMKLCIVAFVLTLLLHGWGGLRAHAFGAVALLAIIIMGHRYVALRIPLAKGVWQRTYSEFQEALVGATVTFLGAPFGWIFIPLYAVNHPGGSGDFVSCKMGVDWELHGFVLCCALLWSFLLGMAYGGSCGWLSCGFTLQEPEGGSRGLQQIEAGHSNHPRRSSIFSPLRKWLSRRLQWDQHDPFETSEHARLCCCIQCAPTLFLPLHCCPCVPLCKCNLRPCPRLAWLISHIRPRCSERVLNMLLRPIRRIWILLLCLTAYANLYCEACFISIARECEFEFADVALHCFICSLALQHLGALLMGIRAGLRWRSCLLLLPAPLPKGLCVPEVEAVFDVGRCIFQDLPQGLFQIMFLHTFGKNGQVIFALVVGLPLSILGCVQTIQEGKWDTQPNFELLDKQDEEE